MMVECARRLVPVTHGFSCGEWKQKRRSVSAPASEKFEMLVELIGIEPTTS